MCRETFRRLPEEKRTRFLEAAWAEFNRVSIAEVSINQIVQKAGIPRGSFYQYFGDKNDLFTYLLESVGDHYISEYRKVLQMAKGNLFEAQKLAFNGFASEELKRDPLFERCGDKNTEHPVAGLAQRLIRAASHENSSFLFRQLADHFLLQFKYRLLHCILDHSLLLLVQERVLDHFIHLPDVLHLEVSPLGCQQDQFIVII